MKGAINLSDVVEQLRTDLLVAKREGEGSELRFALDSVEIELRVAVTKDIEGGAKAKFWVIEAGGKGKFGDSKTQTIRLKMTPKGPHGPVDISG